MNNQKLETMDARRAKEKLEFYDHLTVYAAISLALVVVNLLITPHRLLFVYPLSCWSVALLMHGLSTFVVQGDELTGRLTRRE